MKLPDSVPAAWRTLIVPELDPVRMAALADFVASERAAETVFPPEDRVFAALELTPPEAVRVLLLGQDPYHYEEQAHGLAFSVPEPVKPPPSLRNIFRELEQDLGIRPPAGGDLTAWGRQGVLLLNSVLTVRAHAAGSHRNRGWEELTDAVLRAVNRGPNPVVFILWGAAAQAKKPWIDLRRHRVIESAHPSPLSAYRGFFGSRPFSRANEYLRELGRPVVDWRLESLQPELELI